MKTRLECRSLGEEKGNFTSTSVRQIRQKDTSASTGSASDSSTGMTTGQLAAGLIAGAGVGILAGILLAPEKGKDVRKKVTVSASKLGDQLTKSYSAGMEKASSLMGKKDDKSGTAKKGASGDTTKQENERVESMIEDATKQPAIAGAPVSTTGATSTIEKGGAPRVTESANKPATGTNKPTSSGGPGVSGKQPGMIE